MWHRLHVQLSLALTVAFVLAATPALAGPAASCAQPISIGVAPVASDCLFILGAAVGLQNCSPECICAPTGMLPATASDALLCLNVAVGSALPLMCPCSGTTTTTAAPATTTTTTTTTIPATLVFRGALEPTTGRFNFNLQLGVPGSDAACAALFAGSHTCTLADLRVAEGKGELANVVDVNSTPITSFWAIDPARPDEDQCTVSVAWDYQTAHTGQFADRVFLNNGAGTLSVVSSGIVCAGSSWVGCCM